MPPRLKIAQFSHMILCQWPRLLLLLLPAVSNSLGASAQEELTVGVSALGDRAMVTASWIDALLKLPCLISGSFSVCVRMDYMYAVEGYSSWMRFWP